MALPVVVNVFICIGLIALSGLFSGLTLGLLSLDTMSLQIIADSGDALEKEHARAIMPIRKKGNQLLCTLLLGNVVVNSFLSIFMANLTTGGLGLLVSTVLIVIFGEILPQALCTRYGLLVGAKTISLTRFFVMVFYVVAYPMSRVLDWILGKEVGTIYSRSELLRLITIHVEDPNAKAESGLTHEDHKLLSGALEYSSKTVKDVMTPVEKVYVIDASTRLNFENMLEIYKSGYTRIPVYEGSRQNIIGILYVKDLILLDPDDEIEVKTVITFHGRAGVRFILDSTPLSEVFRLFKQSVYHMMIAVQLKLPEGHELSQLVAPGTTPSRNALSDLLNQNTLLQAERTVTGVITLEDVLEEVIKDEIMDETDVAEAEARGRRGAYANRADISQYMSVFSHKARDHSKLSPQEVDAVAAYLSTTVNEFKPFQRHESVLKGLVRNAVVLDFERHESDSEFDSPDDTSESGDRTDAASSRVDVSLRAANKLAPNSEANPHSHVLYRRGEPSEYFTLILQGHVTVRAGSEEFHSELGPWSVLGNRALDVAATYVPDFTATVTPPARCVRINKTELFAAMKAAQMDAALAKRAIKRVSEAISRTAQSKNLLPSPSLVAAVTDQSLRDLIATGGVGSELGSGATSSTPRPEDQPPTPHASSRNGFAPASDFNVQSFFDGSMAVNPPPAAPAMQISVEDLGGNSPPSHSVEPAPSQRHYAHSDSVSTRTAQPLYYPFQLSSGGAGPGHFVAIPASALSATNRMLLTNLGTAEEQENRLLQVAAQSAQAIYAQTPQGQLPPLAAGFYANPAFQPYAGQLMVPLPVPSEFEAHQALIRNLQEKAGGVPPSPAVTYVSFDPSGQTSQTAQPTALDLSPTRGNGHGLAASSINGRPPRIPEGGSGTQSRDDVSIAISSGPGAEPPEESPNSLERRPLISVEMSHIGGGSSAAAGATGQFGNVSSSGTYGGHR